ncbi:CAAX protease family protein [Alkalihalophilus pseudofirmus]|uniref:CPBP family intramembrane glutamic endopeptidase n=1 Tax=Alkalihalobacterium alkalinitrilicum TaxID=427920 RepID=UPI00094DAE9D|nr:CPBP family intramembrane glutamic endopeptidase [Alkalihalobacterium alkalinitrilicum]OLO26695.1 CAAX protease family protein [Alkalihalophilus pseudofirmus]
MSKRYWWVLITYIAMHMSAFIGVPLLKLMDIPLERIPGIWSTISFSAALLIIVILLLPDIRNRHQVRGRSSKSEAAMWSVLGVLLAFVAQYISIYISVFLLGVEPGSENTERISEYARIFPLFIIIMAVIGPILEEIIFRQVIFGSLYKKYNFIIAALISSLIFALVHMDLDYILVYTALAFVFAYLYVKTKRILVPIIAHVAMNTIAVLVHVIYGERLDELQRQLEQIQSFIGGFIV